MNPWAGNRMNSSPIAMYPQTEGSKTGDPQIEHICGDVERSDHHCGDDLVQHHFCLELLNKNAHKLWE